MTLDEILDWQEQMGTRLRRYGGTLITVAGCDTVQPVDANDNARRRFQYRGGGGLRQSDRRRGGHREHRQHEARETWRSTVERHERSRLHN
ncbi:MAG: hypothetical protein DMF95_23200 [Acidobacteria bacterium]|nr:MAG: hypothetical protein DMF96_16140 [Acidobacteriota bacterium]PYR19667.1 MAG: hypothetical protein DMF94_14800 [Acidobacteriota bacterium]PYR44534.1 MAG: hypothetical protein DMF95_23200 [Acidobacteriota bacterium]